MNDNPVLINQIVDQIEDIDRLKESCDEWKRAHYIEMVGREMAEQALKECTAQGENLHAKMREMEARALAAEKELAELHEYVNALNIAQLKAENEIRQQAIRGCAEVAERQVTTVSVYATVAEARAASNAKACIAENIRDLLI